MLRNVKIDGFKSLSEFSFDILPGLNVLVGANGSGKTTIIKAFEFLSNIAVYRLSDAIGRSGGAGEVFDISRNKDGAIGPQYLNFSCSGDGNEAISMRGSKKSYNIKYRFSAKIMFDATKAEVAFVNQSLEISVSRLSKVQESVTVSIRWDLGKLSIEKSNSDDYNSIFGDESNNYYKYLENRSNLLFVFSLTSQIFFYRHAYHRIIRDIYFGKSFNIIPENVKKDEDIASTPKINPDGSGLAATLFHVTRSDRDENADFIFFENATPIYDKDMLKKINDLLRLVNENVHDLTVKPNYTENKLSIMACVTGDGEEFRVPLRYLSDGTVKWLALSAAILSKPSVFILEEPENFLHPKMLAEAINLMRNTFRGDKDRFIILSSHSETLINLLKPEELVVVSYSEGKSQTARLNNSKQLVKLINKTGFGLGWYFVANALGAE